MSRPVYMVDHPILTLASKRTKYAEESGTSWLLGESRIKNRGGIKPHDHKVEKRKRVERTALAIKGTRGRGFDPQLK